MRVVLCLCKLKILLAFIVVTSGSITAIVNMFRSYSAAWFIEDAHSTLEMGERVISFKLQSVSKSQLKALNSFPLPLMNYNSAEQTY